jgi:hypothetical protein
VLTDDTWNEHHVFKMKAVGTGIGTAFAMELGEAMANGANWMIAHDLNIIHSIAILVGILHTAALVRNCASC